MDQSDYSCVEYFDGFSEDTLQKRVNRIRYKINRFLGEDPSIDDDYQEFGSLETELGDLIEELQGLSEVSDDPEIAAYIIILMELYDRLMEWYFSEFDNENQPQEPQS